MDRLLRANPDVSKSVGNPMASMNSNRAPKFLVNPDYMKRLFGTNSNVNNKIMSDIYKTDQSSHASKYVNSSPGITHRNKVAPYPTPQQHMAGKSQYNMQKNGPSMQYGGDTRHQSDAAQGPVVEINHFSTQVYNSGVKQPPTIVLNIHEQQTSQGTVQPQTYPCVNQTGQFYPQNKTNTSPIRIPDCVHQYGCQYPLQSNMKKNISYQSSSAPGNRKVSLTPASDVKQSISPNPVLKPTFSGMRPSLPAEKDGEILLTFLLRDGVILVPFFIKHNLTVGNYVFNLQPSHQKLLRRPDVELQLKCFHHKDVEKNTNWPPFVEVSVNSNPLFIERDENNNSNKSLYFKQICKPGKNIIEITAFASCSNHLFLLQLVRRLTLKSVVQGLLRKQLLPASFCIEKIKRNITSANVPFSGRNDGIERTAINVSLKCPISFKRMSVPARGKECQHIQCFDLESYLKLNNEKFYWSCPMCNKPAHLQDLEVDQYIWGIATSHTNSVVEEIRIDSTGNWNPVHINAIKEESDRRVECRICSEVISSDNAAYHLSMCLTKPRNIYKYYNEDVLAEDKGKCAICFENLTKGSVIARLSCLCIYHKSCMDVWFKIYSSCPIHSLD